MDSIFTLLLILSGALLGGTAAWYMARSRFHKPLPFTIEEYTSLKTAREMAEVRLNDTQTELEKLKTQLHQLIEKNSGLSNERVRLESALSAVNEKLAEQKKEVQDLHQKMKTEFENIAGKIVFDNSRHIQQQHSDKLNDLLSPLREKIDKFESTVNTTHKENIRDNQALKEQIKQLQDLNTSIGKEARNLTTALKGEVKTQGNWGEVILETVLERSGLVKDIEYTVQSSFRDESGKRLLPDVLVRLPEGKTIIIDSKVSLNAYERLATCESEEEREAAAKEHLISLRRHIKGLGEKKYQQIYQINTLDFVLLFIPIEPAFSAAIQHDATLFNDAFENNIVIVSPSTLLATLRTIAGIWKLEYQNKNALEIARQGGALYDKFVGFLEDFQKIGSSLSNTQKLWDQTMNKLSTGHGNLVGRVEKLKQLGAKATKKIPGELLNDDDEIDSGVESIEPNES